MYLFKSDCKDMFQGNKNDFQMIQFLVAITIKH